jgi:tetratricopeptide (TPR) repeat protein
MSTWKLGNIYLHQHKTDKAQAYLEDAIRQKPNLIEAFGDLGKLYMDGGKYDRAVVYLQKAVQLDPTELNPHYLLSSTYRHLGNVTEAQAEMDVFEKLSKARTERRRPSDAILAGPDDQTKDIKPVEDPPAPPAPPAQ